MQRENLNMDTEWTTRPHEVDDYAWSGELGINANQTNQG